MTPNEIVAAIRELSPAQRRTLLRRLRASGLLEPQELLSDQNRLRVAPALGRRAAANGPAHLRPTNGSAPPAAQVGPVDTETYHSPVRGKMFVALPEASAAAGIDGAQDEDPHAMPPLPGRAPEQPIRIVFDGGSRGNPGHGYGSYALKWPGLPQQVVRLQFGEQVTNNEAEYDALIAALEAILQRLLDADADPATARLDMRGDSQLVINQVLGQWRCNHQRLRVRRDRARELLQQFGSWQLSHHDRSNSVKVLGH